jgi:hypothetical protein
VKYKVIDRIVEFTISAKFLLLGAAQCWHKVYCDDAVNLSPCSRTLVTPLDPVLNIMTCSTRSYVHEEMSFRVSVAIKFSTGLIPQTPKFAHVSR